MRDSVNDLYKTGYGAERINALALENIELLKRTKSFRCTWTISGFREALIPSLNLVMHTAVSAVPVAGA